MRRPLLLSLALAASCAFAADEYPSRAVRVVVPFAPGGGTDVVGRILAQQLTLRLGQSFVIENKPAGSGIVGADFVAKAPRATATRCCSRSRRSPRARSSSAISPTIRSPISRRSRSPRPRRW